jgi:hypothetical protein
VPLVSQIDEVIEGLLAAGVSAGLNVLDGNDEPSSRSLNRCLIVGGDGDFTGTPRAVGGSDQVFAAVGGPRDEQGSITCAMLAQSGGDALTTVREWSLTDLTAFEAALRADETLGGRVAAGLIAGQQLYAFRSREGATVRRVLTYRFTVYQDGP